jgi:hypothetical protein
MVRSLSRTDALQVPNQIRQVLAAELGFQVFWHKRLGRCLDSLDLVAEDDVFDFLGAA